MDKKPKKYPLPDSSSAARAVILADGEYPLPGSIANDILRAAPCVVCCDGAADNFIAHGGVPSAIVGDGDSVSPATAARFADRMHCTSEQESNDLTKAFRYCMSQGFSDIIILGATGRREDHTLGNIGLLADYATRAEVCMITSNGVFNAIGSPSRFACHPGQQVSIFTLATDTRVTVEGLLYIPPADGLRSWWRGTLNEALTDEFTIGTDGPTLIFRVF